MYAPYIQPFTCSSSHRCLHIRRLTLLHVYLGYIPRHLHQHVCSYQPEYFKEHEFLTLGSGKLYHKDLPPNFDTPYSWSYGDAGDPTGLKLPYVYPGGEQYKSERILVPPVVGGCASKYVVAGDQVHWCALNLTAIKIDNPSWGPDPLEDMVKRGR